MALIVKPLLRAAIIIFFQTQRHAMMAQRGEWPMGHEIVWHHFLLTSATGAATVTQQQCREKSHRWEELKNENWQLEEKDWEWNKVNSNSLTQRPTCLRIWTLSSLTMFFRRGVLHHSVNQDPLLPLPSSCKMDALWFYQCKMSP